MFNKILTKVLKRTGHILETKIEAINAVLYLRQYVPNKCGIIYNYIGEHNTISQQIYEAVSQYFSLLQWIPYHSTRELSIKPSQFGSKAYLIERIAKQMAEKGNTLWIDAEDYYLSDSQLVLAERLASLYGSNFIGLTLQLKSNSYFNDAIKCFERGIKVRLCKGAYPSSLTDHHSLINRAERIVEQSNDRFIEIATMKDMDLVMLAIKHRLPLQVLYGWHEKFLDYPYGLKIYVPFGTDWWPYIKRRIRERVKR